KKYEVAEKKVDTHITTGNTNINAPSFGTCKETMYESRSDMIVRIQNENTYRDGYYDKHNDYSTQEYRDIFEYDDWGDEELNDVGDEEPNDVGEEEMSLEDIVNEVKRNFSLITNAKALINENIFKGLDMFLNNKDLLTLTITDHVIFDKILESLLGKASMKEAECKYKRLQPINIDFSKDRDVANGVSANNEEPKADKKGDDKKLVSARISKSKIRPRSLNEIFLEKTRAKREVKLPDSLKSSYINRIVDCKRRLQLDEKEVLNWLFTCTEEENDIVFEAHGQLIGYKGIMESLRPGLKIQASVGDAMMNKRMSNARKCELFNTNLKVCFPIVQSGQFCYITFNMIKDEVHVIDNLTVCPNYKELPKKLISKFTGYLTEINNHKASSIGRIKPVRLEFT
nr:ulp1 protease family, C-terminal catalytic domain-containing protein [Tanacetum cinerariifolium]